MKTQPNHTPGPWEMIKEIGNDGGLSCKIVSGNKAVIALAKHADGNKEANARLIAAAPELLEALIDLLDDSDEYDKRPIGIVAAKARAAIAKATGKTL